MKTILRTIFTAGLLSFIFNGQVFAQDYFAGDPKVRCVDSQFRETLINAFSKVNDTVRCFKSEDIINVTYEAECSDLQRKGYFTDALEFPFGKLTISYSGKDVASNAYLNIAAHTKFPAYSDFAGFVKPGRVYVCLKQNVIEIYKTNDVAESIIDSQRLETYIHSNKNNYNKIMVLSADQYIIK